MDTIQIVLIDNNKVDAETQTPAEITMPEFENHPIEYREIISTVRNYIANTYGDDVVAQADNDMEQAGIDDLDMFVNLDDIKAYLDMFVSFVKGINIKFNERYREFGELLDDGDTAA